MYVTHNSHNYMIYTILNNFLLKISRSCLFFIFGGSMFQSFIVAGVNELAYIWPLCQPVLHIDHFYEDICALGLALHEISVSLDFNTGRNSSCSSCSPCHCYCYWYVERYKTNNYIY